MCSKQFRFMDHARKPLYNYFITSICGHVSKGKAIILKISVNDHLVCYFFYQIWYFHAGVSIYIDWWTQGHMIKSNTAYLPEFAMMKKPKPLYEHAQLLNDGEFKSNLETYIPAATKFQNTLIALLAGFATVSLNQWTLTFSVRGPSYPGLTRPISWLLMPWPLASPEHQQPSYWLCNLSRSISYRREAFNHLCHVSVEGW